MQGEMGGSGEYVHFTNLGSTEALLEWARHLLMGLTRPASRVLDAEGKVSFARNAPALTRILPTSL